MKKNILIVGASAAGIGAVVKLRKLDTESSITILTAEQEMPYNRCLLADHLAGSKELEDIATKKEDFFSENNIILKLNSRVARLLPNENKVELECKTTLSYDQLFLGIGRSSRVIPIPGYKSCGVFSFYDLKDTCNILSFIQKNKVNHAVIIGAGLSGVECADALAAQNIPSTIIEQGPHVLPCQLDQGGAACLEKLMRQHGVSIIPKQTVASINEKDAQVKSVTLSSGEIIKTNMVVFAIGGKINSNLAQEAGIECQDEGIIVDETMKTSVDNIFAGGDVCKIKDLLSGEYIQSCLWTDAIMQGFAAAQAMSGQPKPYKGSLIITSSHIFGTTFVTSGPINNQQLEYKEFSSSGENFHHHYLLKDGKLKGFCLVGRVDHVGKLRQALLSQKTFLMPEQEETVIPQTDV